VRYYNKKMETMPRHELDRLKLHLLRKVLKHAYGNSRFYRRTFRKAGFDPSSVKRLEDLSKAPFTSKMDLMIAQEGSPPFGDMLTVPVDTLSTVVATTGTTGNPIMVPLSEFDSTQYCSPDSQSWLRTLYSCGYRKGDIIQSAWNYGFWYFSGSCLSFTRSKCEPPFIISGIGRSSWQLQLMERMRTTMFFATQSYGLFIGQKVMELSSKKRDKIKIRSVVQGGEPGLLAIDNFRQRMKDAWCSQGHEVDFFESAGASEIGYFGQECVAHQGLHVPEDYIHIEVLDEDGSPVAPGEKGEMVMTHLQREAMPLIRYRIGDVTVAEYEKCGCGRTHLRLQGIVGRTDDMVKVKGIKFFPSQVESIVRATPGCTGEFLITIDKDQAEVLDSFKVTIEHFPDADVKGLRKELDRSIRALVSVAAELVLVPQGEMPRSPHKALRILDKRKYGAEDRFKNKIEFARRVG
jgi:phenylacetate-CoA ligase